MKWGALGGAHRPLAWWILFIVLLGACSGELTSDGEPFGSGGDGRVAGSPETPASGGTGGLDPGDGGTMAGTGGDGGVNGGQGGAGGTGGAPTGQGGSAGTPIEPPPGTIPMFVAQGIAGRTLISCDDGRSWVADQSDRGWKYCDSNDCSHDSGAGKGVIWADGWFFLTFGWGAPGSIRRSRDGVTWEPMLVGKYFGGLAYGNGRIVAGNKFGRYSDDLGKTWPDPGQLLPFGGVRATAFVPHGAGLFLFSASGSTASEIRYSSDGISWNAPDSQPATCAEDTRQSGRIVYGNGTIVTTGGNGVICRSTDGGVTWTSKSISNQLGGNGIWTGSEFMTWDRGTVFRSTDGDTWTETDTVPNDVDVGVVAISARGTIAAITGGGKDYDDQRAYRSVDGVHWEELSESAFVQGHAMRAMAFGYGQPSEYCP